ncbi:hypothetical protein [Oligoflexus tunisiensis]|uniref:hypothetical protein n=1 Tax=Oligoflexus tunisiensis TaxID=708132 RepID=UPI00114D0313|nr:hypothetical protein [Oligoflexus tunisiensis]
MKAFLVSMSLLLGTAAPLMAHEGHNHEAAVEAAPHGGTLRNAGDYKAEIVINGDNLKLYVYDKKLKPVKLEKAELTGDVQFPKEKSKPVTFKKAGDYYEATVKGITKVHRYDMHVNIEVAGKKVVADFGIDNI